jgi:cholest-4-en-3-one 26-monooxygenase
VSQTFAPPRPTAPVPSDLDLLSGDFWGDDPHPALTWMRHHHPVHWDGQVWGVATHHLIREVSRRPEVFSNAAGMRPDLEPMPMMTDVDDPEHRLRRALVGRAFRPRQVRSRQADVARWCDEILDAVATRDTCDFVADVAAWLPLVVIADTLGFPPEDRGLLLRWSDDRVKGLVGGEPGPAMEHATEAYLGFRDLIGRAVAQRRRQPTDDLLSTLANGDLGSGPLDDESVIHEALLILLGGDETTRHVLSGGLYQLASHPDQLRLLVDEPDRIPVAVEEMLRWVSPIKSMNRTVRLDTDLGGERLRAGQKVLLLYPSANRDEAVFDEPFRFDVTRQPNDHLAFGVGAHHCLGSALARLELVCLFEHLQARFPNLTLVEPTEPPNRRLNFVTGYDTLAIRLGAQLEAAAPIASTSCPVDAHDQAWCSAAERWDAVAKMVREPTRAVGPGGDEPLPADGSGPATRPDPLPGPEPHHAPAPGRAAGTARLCPGR